LIPLKDLNPTTRPAYLTIILILINVGVFVLVQQGQRGTETLRAGETQVTLDKSTAFTLEHAAIPCEVTHDEPLTLDELEATFNNGDTTACGKGAAEPELFPHKQVYLAILFSMFLHGGWLHLGGNMLFLWIFGNNVEDRLGRLGYLAFYLIGGFVAAAAHILVQPSSTVPVIGASGAIAAVMGAYLVWYPRAKIRTIFFVFLIFYMEISAKWLLLFWFVSQFFTDPRSGVAWVAHVGGFVFGIIAAYLLGRSRAPA
jgi:membrane associated rhomboid family serine protease